MTSFTDKAASVLSVLSLFALSVGFANPLPPSGSGAAQPLDRITDLRRCPGRYTTESSFDCYKKDTDVICLKSSLLRCEESDLDTLLTPADWAQYGVYERAFWEQTRNSDARQCDNYIQYYQSCHGSGTPLQMLKCKAMVIEPCTPDELELYGFSRTLASELATEIGNLESPSA